jgi:hypothetical protein
MTEPTTLSATPLATAKLADLYTQADIERILANPHIRIVMKMPGESLRASDSVARGTPDVLATSRRQQD